MTPRLEALGDEDLFVWIHLMEVHGPYGPYGGLPDGVELPPGGEPIEWSQEFDQPWNTSPTRASRVALYGLDLELLDESLGEFLELFLGRWETGQDEGVIVAVAADHGELLGEYDRWGHMWSRMVPETMHVPLIIRAPGLIEGGRVWEHVVENMDLGPTLLDLAGILDDRQRARWDRGHSLLPLLDGRIEANDRDMAVALLKPDEGDWGTCSVFGPDAGLIGEGGRLVGTIPFAGRGEYRTLGLAENLIEISHGVARAFSRYWIEHLRTQELLHRRLQAASLEGPRDGLLLDAEALGDMVKSCG